MPSQTNEWLQYFFLKNLLSLLHSTYFITNLPVEASPLLIVKMVQAQ